MHPRTIGKSKFASASGLNAARRALGCLLLCGWASVIAQTRIGGNVAVTGEIIDGGGGSSSAQGEAGEIANELSLDGGGDTAIGGEVFLVLGFPASSPLSSRPVPTAATLSSFDVTAGPTRQLLATWQTGVEWGFIGFVVERLEPGGTWTWAHPYLVPATGAVSSRYTIPLTLSAGRVAQRYRLKGFDLAGLEEVIAVASVQTELTVGIGTDGTRLEVRVQGVAGQRAELEVARRSPTGPWESLQSVFLDNHGVGKVPLDRDGQSGVEFFRLRQP